MRLFLDERALVLPEGGVEQARAVIEDFLDVVAATRLHEEERVFRSDSVWDQPVRPDLSLTEFLYPETPDPALADARRRLGLALDRMASWEDEGTPNAFQVELDGKVVEAPTLAWAWAQRRRGEAVGCLAFAGAGPSGLVPVTVASLTVELYFISEPRQRLDFLRRSIVIEAVTPVAFPVRAARAFPTLLWQEGAMAELRANKASFFDDRLPKTVLHLSVLDDHGAAIFQAHDEQTTRAAHLGSHGVDASSESGKAKGNKKAVKEHTRRWRGQDVQFWWHTKLTHDDGRIHFLHEPRSEEDPADANRDHPHGRIVIGICVDHLTV